MEEDSLFDKNIARFATQQPKIAYLLPYHNAEDLQPCYTVLKEPNLCKEPYTFHDPEGAAKEADAWFRKLPLEGKEVLFVVGTGLGYAYDAAKKWLRGDTKRHLFFLEDDLSVLYYLFSLPVGERILHDPQVTLRYSKDLLLDKELSDWLCWDCFSQSILVSALPFYQKHRVEFVSEVEQKLLFDHHRLDEAIEEYLDHGISYYRNFYSNVLLLHESYLADRLFGKFAGVPAIICGAGPSLEKDLPLLATLKDRAIIFAGGSAINALNASGLQPHFGVGVDPNLAQYARYMAQDIFEVPFFYRQRLNHQAFKLIHGPRLYLSGSGGYDTAGYFEECLGIESDDLDEGHNVVNLCTSIAHAMGCNPIIFVGMDLGYTGMKPYASGVDQHAAVQDDTIIRTDVHGKPFHTLWKWVIEADWLGEFAKNHSDTTFINATDAGLGFKNVVNRPLSQIELPSRQSIENAIHRVISEAALPSDAFERIRKAWNELSASLSRSIGLMETIIGELKVLWEQEKEDFEVKTGALSVAEVQLNEEEAFGYVLSVFNEVFVRLLNRDLRLLKASEQDEQTQYRKKLELEMQRYLFLLQTAKANQQIMADALSQHEYFPSEPGLPSRTEEDGLVEYRYPDGTIRTTLPYHEGHLHGEVRLYHPNGELKRVIRYHQGRRQE